MFERRVNIGGLVVSLLSAGEEAFSVDKNYLPFPDLGTIPALCYPGCGKHAAIP